MLLTMGTTNSMYVDGDIPRPDYSILLPGGWAYYKSSVMGQCSKCREITNYWHVTIKSKGKYMCQQCNYEAGQKIGYDVITI